MISLYLLFPHFDKLSVTLEKRQAELVEAFANLIRILQVAYGDHNYFLACRFSSTCTISLNPNPLAFSNIK